MADDEPLDLSIGGYLSRKRARLAVQFQTIADRQSALLAGIHVFVNGRTVPGQRTLWQLITKHGGSFSAIMSPGVTHVVASGLAQTKIAQFRKSRVHVVTPDWIIESIKNNGLLSVADFSVPELTDSSQPSLTDYFGRSSKAGRLETEPAPVSDNIVSDDFDDSNHNVAEAQVYSSVIETDPLSKAVDIVSEPPPASDQESKSDSITEGNGVTDQQNGVQDHSTLYRHDDSQMRFPATEEEMMRRIGDHRFDKIPFANPKLPSCTLTDPDFVRNYFSQSRLHFIGSWKEKFECCLVDELRQQKPLYSLGKGERGHILHVDMDCFFASVSIRDQPDLKTKPVVVSHSKSGTGEVSTCNYVARAFGIRSGMWMDQARTLCPDLVVIGFEFQKYAAASEAIYRVFYTFTHSVQVLSCDEALLEIPHDVNPVDVGEQIRSEIFLATGCTASVGIGESILFARIATRFAKPNGLLFILPEQNEVYLTKLKTIQDLPGVGPATAESLQNSLKIDSIEQLRDVSLTALQSVLGHVQAQALYDYARGIDRRSLLTEFKQRSQIGTELGWGIRFFVPEQIEHFLSKLCIEVASRLEMANRFGLVVSLRVKKRHPRAPIYPAKFLGQGWCDTISKSVTLPVATRDSDVLFSQCKTLIRLLDIPPYEIRAIGLYVTRLQTTPVAVNTINNYFTMPASSKANSAQSAISSSTTCNDSVPSNLESPISASHIKENVSKSSKSIMPNPSVLEMPKDWDPAVFLELPEEVRKELLEQIPAKPPITPAVTKLEDSHAAMPIDFDNIDVNVLHELPRDVRMEIQFELKKRRIVKAKQPKPTTPNVKPTSENISTNSSLGDVSHSDKAELHPDLNTIRSYLTQSDDAIITFVLSLMERHLFLQVEQTLSLWRKQCQSTPAFNLALELVQERTSSVFQSKFKIDPL